jgi:protein-tyrosine phosphatase
MRLVALHPGNYDPAPLNILCAEKLQDLVGGGPPRNPERERETIERIVRLIVEALRAGDGVAVHCVGGRGRTGTVLGCVLRELGHGATEVVDYLDRVHKARGKSGWPESPWQAQLVRAWRSDG